MINSFKKNKKIFFNLIQNKASKYFSNKHELLELEHHRLDIHLIPKQHK
jgi:hypothetical protein